MTKERKAVRYRENDEAGVVSNAHAPLDEEEMALVVGGGAMKAQNADIAPELQAATKHQSGHFRN